MHTIETPFGDLRAEMLVNLQQEDEAGPLVVCVPGWKGCALTSNSTRRIAEAIVEAGAKVLLLNFPGHGDGSHRSGGDISSFTVDLGSDAIQFAIEDALNRFPIDENRIGIFGKSVGGGIALLAASLIPGVKWAGTFAARWNYNDVSDDCYDNNHVLKQSGLAVNWSKVVHDLRLKQTSVLVMHGRSDNVVNPVDSLSLRLMLGYRMSCLHWIENCKHHLYGEFLEKAVTAVQLEVQQHLQLQRISQECK